MPYRRRPAYEPPLSRSVGGPWMGTSFGRGALIATGCLLFVVGLLLFVGSQTQLLFTDLAQVPEIQTGFVPRNDAGILLGALLLGGGPALALYSFGPYPQRSRMVQAFVFGASVSFLILLHFTMFVNAFLLPNARSAEIAASFLFHDSATAIPIAVYLLALFTGALVLVALLAALALVAPDVWERQVLHPQNVEAHRTRTVLLGLFVLGTGAAFARQFFAYGLTGDRYPAGGAVALNVTVVYYLVGFALVLALLAFAARTALLTWGDLRVSPSYNFRRSYRSVTHVEAGLWITILLLNTILLFAGPTFQPDGRADRVFAVNSKGVSLFFHLVAVLYVVHRWTSHRYLRFLRRHPAPPSATRGWDLLATLSVTVIVTWSLLAVLLWQTDTTPLARLALRLAVVAALLPLFAFRGQRNPFVRPTPRNAGALTILLAAATLSILAGIMLWGMGNSISTRYLEGAGFMAARDAGHLWYRWLGAAFLALPLVLVLRSVATRHHARLHPGPILVVGLSVLLAMNLLFATTPTSIQPESGRTDVVVGFNHVQLPGADGFALLAIGAATAAVGFVAAALLIHKGATRPPERPPVPVAETPEHVRAPTARAGRGLPAGP